MITEQDFNYTEKVDDILKEIYEKDSVYEDPESNIVIKYFGNKSQIPLKDPQKKWEDQEEQNNLLDPGDPKNYLVFMKYDNIYIGAISTDDLKTRDHFGLNIYSQDCFYVGHWKDNMKEGIGFLKINNDKMYVGNFSKNQLDGFGMFLDKGNKIFFFGNFNNGAYEDGIYYDYLNECVYRGKVINGKKNDNLCSYYDGKNKTLFIGEIIDDEFNKGYVSFFDLTPDKIINANDEEEEILRFNTKEIYYYDGLFDNHKLFFSSKDFRDEFYEKLKEIIYNIFIANDDLKKLNESFLDYFYYLERITNNDKFTENPEKYNSFDENNEDYVENNFNSNYSNYFQRLETIPKIDLSQFENSLDPEIIPDYEKASFQNDLI